MKREVLVARRRWAAQPLVVVAARVAEPPSDRAARCNALRRAVARP